jgi:hypothetical protein
MNLDKYNKKENLEDLIKNEEEFFHVIDESNGFILELVKNHNLKPDLQMMMENMNVFTVQFITDNYTLNKEQTVAVSEFLSEENTSRVQKVLSHEEIVDYLKNKKALPTNVNFSVEDINKYYKEIEAQYKLDEEGIQQILSSSFRKFNLEDILKLDKEFLKNEIHLMNSKRSFFNDKNYRELYKEIVFSYHKNPTMSEFKRYVFTPEDKDLLHTLLTNESSKSSWRDDYAEYSGIQGFSALIDKYEYFEKYNPDNLSSFTDGEVEKNPDVFKRALLNNVENRSTYETFNQFFRRKMTVRQFKAILDEEFIEKFISSFESSRAINRFFGHQDAEYDKSVIDKKAHIAKIVGKFYADDKVLEDGRKITDIVDMYGIVSAFKDLLNERYEPINQADTEQDIREIGESLKQSFTNILPKSLNNKDFYDIYSHADHIFTPETIKLAENFVSENVNVNAFSLLMNVYGQNRSKRSYDGKSIEFMETLVQYIDQMHDELVKKNNHDEIVGVSSILNYYKLNEDKFVKKLLKDTPKRKGYTNSDENNFLNYELNDLTKLSDEMWAVIYNIRPDFSDYIIKNKIEVPNNLIHSCLNSVNNNGNEKSTKFLTEYAKIHRETIEANEKLFSSFLACSRQSEIFPLSSTTHLDGYYKEIMTLLNRMMVIDEKKEEIKKLFPRQEMPYSRKGEYPEINLAEFNENVDIPSDIPVKDAKLLYLNLYEKKSELKKELDAKEDLLPYSFMTEKIEELIEKRDFNTVLAIKDERIKYNNDPFVNYVNNIKFDELKDNLKSKSFYKLLKEQINYENETEIKFPDFGYEKNMELAVELLKVYRENRSEGYSDSSTYKFLNFFAEENREFIKEFVIEHLPTAVFYGYDFFPEHSDNFNKKKFIVGNYSNEEIYKAFQNMENQGGFFSYKDVNASFDTFFSRALFPERRNKEKNNDERFKSFLEFIKDKSEVLYTAMVHNSIYINSLDWGESSKNPETRHLKFRDAIINHYFHKTFDFDTVLKGVEKIAAKMSANNLDEDGQDIINKKVAGRCITYVVHNTYYEDLDKYGRTDKYCSLTSEEDTLKLFKVLYEHAPLHLIERHVIGTAGEDTVGFFKKHIHEFVDLEKVKNFILPNDDVTAEYLQIKDEDSPQKDRLLGFTRALIEYAVENRDTNIIDFLNHSIKQRQFVEREMDWRKRGQAYKGIYDRVISVIANDNVVKGLLQNAKLKMELEDTLEIKEPVVKRRSKI